MWTREATYQIRERAKALITNDLPQKDKERDRQDFSTLSTAAIGGRQLSSSRFPTPIKTPRALILTEFQSKTTGGSTRPDQLRSQRPLDFDWLSLEPGGVRTGIVLRHGKYSKSFHLYARPGRVSISCARVKRSEAN